MAPSDLQCPVCSADLLLAGDESAGEEVFCSYCGAPCLLRQTSEGAMRAEEDF